jgi:hypothetical protein
MLRVFLFLIIVSLAILACKPGAKDLRPIANDFCACFTGINDPLAPKQLANDGDKMLELLANRNDCRAALLQLLWSGKSMN